MADVAGVVAGAGNPLLRMELIFLYLSLVRIRFKAPRTRMKFQTHRVYGGLTRRKPCHEPKCSASESSKQ